MGVFDYLIAITIGVFAQTVKGRNGFLWAGLTIGTIAVVELYSQRPLWVIFVSIVVVLVLVGLKPKP